MNLSMQQRYDLRRCEFCGTRPIEQVWTSDRNTVPHWMIRCGNPFCEMATRTEQFLKSAEAEREWEGTKPNGDPVTDNPATPGPANGTEGAVAAGCASSIEDQFYSPSTGERFTVFKDTPVEAELEWIESHKDAIRLLPEAR